MADRKWALVTGVSEGGLGDALSMAFLSRNIHVVATGINAEQLKYLDTLKTDGKLQTLALDVTSSQSISNAVSNIQQITDGKLHFLVDNAGYGYMMPLMDANIPDVQRNFNVNVFGLLAVTQAFFPMLRAAQGLVVNQASIAGLDGVCQPFIGTYSASKAAVTSMSNTLRVELAPFGIKVVTLVTGDVKTHFWGNVDGAHSGLPSSSPYLPIKDKAETMMRGETNAPGQHAAEKWAQRVVEDLIQSHPPRFVRRGHLASTMSWVSWLCPTWAFDWIFTQTSGLGKLKTILHGPDKAKKDL